MIHAHLFSLIFFETLSLTGGFDLDEEFHLQIGALKGDFEVKPVDGATCRWVEGVNQGGGPREFIIFCRIPLIVQGQRGLVKAAATNQPNACNRKDLVYKECKNVIFVKQ